MKIEKLIEHEARSLVLFFSGWAASPVQFRELRSKSDVWVAYDYRDLTVPFVPGNYKEVYVVAWSMGVWVATQVVRKDFISSATAINGTPFPCHDEWGIPRDIFRGTLEKLDEANFARFCRRMCGSSALGKQFEKLNDRRISELKEELSFLSLEIGRGEQQRSFPWTRALVSLHDRIFPVDNLRRYWENAGVPIVELDAPHHPFHLWKTWEDIWKC